jgi:hypothetical protein
VAEFDGLLLLVLLVLLLPLLVLVLLVLLLPLVAEFPPDIDVLLSTLLERVPPFVCAGVFCPLVGVSLVEIFWGCNFRSCSCWRDNISAGVRDVSDLLEPSDEIDAAELLCNAVLEIVEFGNDEARDIFPAAATDENPEMALVLVNL